MVGWTSEKTIPTEIKITTTRVLFEGNCDDMQNPLHLSNMFAEGRREVLMRHAQHWGKFTKRHLTFAEFWGSGATKKPKQIRA